MQTPPLPEVRVVRGAGHSSTPVRAYVARALEPIRPRIRDTLAAVLGLWPLVVAVLVAGGLMWSMAMSMSP